MKRKKFHNYVITGMKLAFGVSLAVTSLIAAIVLLIIVIASKIMNHWLNEGKEIMKKREKHPYYDSDRKKQTESAALKMIAICIVGMVLCLIFAKYFS